MMLPRYIITQIIERYHFNQSIYFCGEERDLIDYITCIILDSEWIDCAK